ncbi:MAG: UDP-3-O-(3-hydroxymyristoyl)glucosamine N-acyltransferase [Gammaproteobacteria bacterium]|nr:UDP-3-O-(3-hydroxymyristoyl)glucosamine N-acyltransferase [Gammaproteobacteria bacterium]NNF59827.1 UDP-3-O-(3-hydroxymyristoyl)glucosamine N-acyltransferase [Gammaproteobacteria bacterium]NNM21299.1 UDP-3-O-(3-hydroxymyristoyl)glucosamine N-acyltransferase [Gammaproteobacteria bacterium]
MSLTVAEIAVRHGCEVRGDPATVVERVATLERAGNGSISFLANPRYRRCLAATGASAVILAAADADECPVTALISDNPYALYARVAGELEPPPAPRPGIHPAAVVAADADVPETCEVAPGAVIEAGARLGAGVIVGPGCVVGTGATIGAGSRLTANVTVCHDVTLGSRCLVHPGTVIGSDGFGIAREPEGWIKVPQLGSVVVGDDVEIGACTSIDRGAIDDTVIGNGVKLDNQIQVAHNVHIGEHTVIAAGSGISGSTRIGRRCMIAGHVGFVGHLDIADDVVITGQTMVNRSISEAGVYSSALPMDEARRWRRNSARFRQLDAIAKRLKKLEKKSGE